ARAGDRPAHEHESESKGSGSPDHCARVGARPMPRRVLVRSTKCTGDGSAPVVIARSFGSTARRRGNRGGSMSQTTRGLSVAAERDADIARREADMVQLEVIAAVKRAYWDLWLVHENLLVHSRDKDLVERLARIAERKYAVGQVSQPDVLRAQVELTRLINRVTTETLGVDTARA